jgi:hypothetical protein
MDRQNRWHGDRSDLCRACLCHVWREISAVGANQDGSDLEGLAGLKESHGTRESNPLVCHGISAHTPYLAHHCR